MPACSCDNALQVQIDLRCRKYVVQTPCQVLTCASWSSDKCMLPVSAAICTCTKQRNMRKRFSPFLIAAQTCLRCVRSLQHEYRGTSNAAVGACSAVRQWRVGCLKLC